MHSRRSVLLLVAFALSAHAAGAQSPVPTPLTSADLDPAAFRQWIEGVEKPVDDAAGPETVVWTSDSSPANGRPRWNGVVFGDSKTPGPRHLRIGFQKPVAVGTVFVSSAARVSVLKSGASYPGDLGDESQWIAAERLDADGVTAAPRDRAEPTLWVLPSGVATRAVRLTHEANILDKTYAARLHGMVVLAKRVANVGPQAVASASMNPSRFALLNNDRHDDWGAWEAWDAEHPPAPVAERPAWVVLTWPAPVTLSALAGVWTGFGGAEVQAYAGPADRPPKEAREDDWQTVVRTEQLDSLYPFHFAPQWIDFGKTVTTRAVRLRIDRPTREGHPHLHGSTKDGRRVWLGELLALRSLDDAPLAAVLPKAASEESHPPIPIAFELTEPGLVTLVLEDGEGQRVRNLVSETPFPAGKHTVWWDGMDDSQRDGEAARHGIYHVTGRFVAPGTYRLRGLAGPKVELRYEFPVYTAGTPAWQTADNTGGWLSNHSPPESALFVPADRAPGGRPLVFLGSYVSEGKHGLAWVDLEGKKVGGMNWVGGIWTGAPLLARDDGPKAVTGVHAYAASVWETEKKSRQFEIRLTALSANGERPVARHLLAAGGSAHADYGAEVAGLAARDGILFVSLRKRGQILVVDARKTTPAADGRQPSGEVKGTFAANDPRGLAFDAQGRLLILSGRQVVRQPLAEDLTQTQNLPSAETLVAEGLDEPRHVALDTAGNLYVSDRGRSHQVKVFNPAGQFLRTIGKPGEPKAGPYDPEHMNHPDGLTIDSRGRLWVTENDEQPKRVSVWTADGKLERAFYGPAAYGGGGKLDPREPTRFYYRGMEFRLDWDRGTFQLARVFYRPGPDNAAILGGHMADGFPEEPIYIAGRRYFTNCYNSNPTHGASLAILWLDRDGPARPVAAFGRANDWALVKSEPFRARWPSGLEAGGDYWRNQAAVLWSDLNSDGQAQPEEVAIEKGHAGGVTMMSDGAFVASRFEGRAVRLAPLRFTADGVPVYDFRSAETLAEKVETPRSSGGDQALAHPSGWTVMTLGVEPFSAYSVSGVYRGQPRWSYPNLWPGLHASHEAPVPDRPGMLVGPTRLLGGFIEPRGDAGPLWLVNGNMGTMYVFTADGLFVRTLFRDFRLGRSWSMPLAQRGMLLNEVTSEGENFWPSVTQTADGRIFLCDGDRVSLVRIDGLDKLRRLPDREVKVTESDLKAAQAWHVQRESARHKEQGAERLRVVLRGGTPTVDGKLDDWLGAEWATIDKRGVRAWFDSNSRPYDVSAAVAVAGDRLYVAYRAGEKGLLRNSGEMPLASFKTGGALDLMLGADPQADPNRTQAAPGDLRLLVTLVPDSANKSATRPLALLYRAVVPGTPQADRVPFSSPWRTIHFDRVDDVSGQVQFAADEGNFEWSVPLATVGLAPKPGLVLRGDLGILRGDGMKTTQRVYWSNKATAITTDVPSEAALAPQLWGRIEFVAPR